MTTATATRTDAEIQRSVLEELKWDARVQPNEVGVAVKDGIVTLTGWVDSYTKRWAAEEAALRVRGVKGVANEIEVRLPSAAQRTDADIAAAAVRALEWDAFIPADKVKVTVSKGWMTLEGEVDWEFERQDAERVVRRLTGVRGVTNLITVKSRPAASELKKKIEEALVRDAETDAQRIQVEVQGSKVILKGTVRSWAEKWRRPARTDQGRSVRRPAAGALAGLAAGGLRGIARTYWTDTGQDFLDVPPHGEYVLVVVPAGATADRRHHARAMRTLLQAGALAFLEPTAYPAATVGPRSGSQPT